MKKMHRNIGIGVAAVVVILLVTPSVHRREQFPAENRVGIE